MRQERRMAGPIRADLGKKAERKRELDRGCRLRAERGGTSRAIESKRKRSRQMKGRTVRAEATHTMTLKEQCEQCGQPLWALPGIT